MRRELQSLVAVCLVVVLWPWPALAKSRKGDGLIAQARQAELRDTAKDLDQALTFAQAALATDRSDIGYQLEVARLRAFAAQYHVYDGQVLRDKGQIKEALVEFERAKELDPASVVAPQELERTKTLANEIRRNPSANVDDLLMRPLPRKNKQDEAQFSTTAPVPQLTVKLLKPLPTVKVNNQMASDVFAAVCKEAKVRILFDPDYQNRTLGLNQTLDFQGASLDQALDYLALVTKSFWKPLSGDTIFVTNDDPMRRGVYEEQVTKALYLTNAPGAQDVTDIANTVQRVTDMKKLLVHPAQNVIIARGDADRMALAEKIVADLDKPKAEIIIDVIILSVSKNWERQLGMNLIGLADSATNVLFNPRALLGPTQVGGRTGVPLDAIHQLEKGDYNVTLPSAALNALLKIGGTKVMDKAQLRTIEGQKSVLRIGQRIPYATGSFSPGSFGGGSSLVNTQFQYFDVGLNIDVIAKVHEPDEVSLHIESDSSAVQDRIDLGGVLQPVISQRKRVADVRVKEGEINFWDIVTQRQDVKASNGLPGLSQIPVLGRVFTNEKLIQTELQVLTLLIPHIIRAPDIRNVNLMGLPSGSDQVVRLRYSTADGRTIAARTSNEVLELQPGPGQPMGMQPGQPMGMQPGQPGMQPGQPMGMQPGQPGMQPGQPMGMQPGQPMGMQPGQPMGMQPGQPMGMQPGQPGQPMGGMQVGPGTAQPGPGPMGGMPGSSPQPGMPAGPGPTNPGPAPIGGAARIFFAAQTRQVAVNGVLNVELVLADGVDVASGSMMVEFDPKMLRLNAATPGQGVVLVDVERSKESGTVILQLQPGAPSTRALASLSFQVVRAGAVRLTVKSPRLVNSRGTDIPVLTEPLTLEAGQTRAAWEAPATLLPGWGLWI